MVSMKAVCLGLLASTILVSCGPTTSDSKLNEAWNSQNNPANVVSSNYVKKWSDLPKQGAIDVKGWSDDYWPTMHGGIGYRWQAGQQAVAALRNPTAEVIKQTMEPFYSYKIGDTSSVPMNQLSPAEKYDLYMDRTDFPTAKSERGRTRIMKTVKNSKDFEPGFKIPGWEGLCHGWAPAALNFKEPAKPVMISSSLGDVTFYPSDIKALLIYHQQYSPDRVPPTSFVADRCHASFQELKDKLDKGEITQEEWQAARDSSSCSDINPGSLHLVLANEIGKQKKGFVIDVTRDAEVWNQPVNGYSTQVVQEKAGASDKAAPGTVKEITVVTKVNYTVEVNPSRRAVGATEKVANYEYVLELNAADEIIGGRWISEDRPDFLWSQGAPEFRGYFALLEDLYEQSIAP